MNTNVNYHCEIVFNRWIISKYIDEIAVFVDITVSIFNFANVLLGLSGVHWQQNLL